MTDQQKSSSGVWLAAGLMLLLVVYPLSIGPLVFFHCLIWPPRTMPDWVQNAVFLIYLPVYLVSFISKELLGEPLRLYVEWWAELAG